MKIETKDLQGAPNGYVVPIWSALENPELRPEQVYVTAVAPRTRKGPHLHKVRRGCFVCIRGDVRIVFRFAVPGPRGTQPEEVYRAEMSGEHHQYRRVVVPPGMPCAIYNDGDEEALVLNLPSPAWSAAAPDENKVEGWSEERARGRAL